MRKFFRREPTVELVEARIVLSATSCVSDGSSAVVSASNFLGTSDVSIRPIIVADNSTDTARELGVLDGENSLVDEYVGRYDTKDVFRFLMPVSGAVSIHVHEVSADVDLYLLDSNHLTVATSTNWGTEAELIQTNLEAGEYFVSVNNYDQFASTQYRLDLQSTLNPTSDAAGSTFDTALQLGVLAGSHSFQDYVGPSDNADLFEFRIDETSDVTINLSSLEGDVDLVLFSQDEFTTGESETSGESNEQIESQLAPGTYYLGVVPFEDGGSNYELTIENTTAAPTEPPIDTPIPPVEPDDPNPPVDVEPDPPTPDPPTPDPPTSDPSVPDPDLPPGHPDLVPPEELPLPDVDYVGGTEEWGINSVFAPEAWAAGYTGQGITVAIIDSGIQMDHPDLLHSVWTNQNELPGDGIDNDGNGYVDDIAGWDFVESDNTPTDGNNHGTHVAGILAAGNNDFGATGVAYAAMVMPLRVLNDKGLGSIHDVATAVRYAVDNGADIVNVSLGGGNSVSMYTALQHAMENDVLVIVAAGNEGADVPGYPARHSATLTNVLSVGAYGNDNQLGSFSNHVGSSNTRQVDAPGVSIYNTLIDGRYGYLSGTSMATPYVSGVAALTLSANPDLTAAQLREVLIKGAVNVVEDSDSIGIVNAATTIPLARTADAADFIGDVTTDSPALVADPADSSPRVYATGSVRQIAADELEEGMWKERTFPKTDDCALLESLLAIESEPDSVDDVFADDDLRRCH